MRDEAFSVGIGLPEGADGDAAPVRVEVSVESGDGRTEAGTTFAAARARATIRLHRARVDVAGRHATAPSATGAARAALLDLAARVARTLAD